MGKISKQWSGMLREMFTDADYFGITFPIDLDVRMKAVMLGACFLIVSYFIFLDFSFFTSSSEQMSCNYLFSIANHQEKAAQ